MKILALEFSSPQRSVAVLCDSSREAGSPPAPSRPVSAGSGAGPAQPSALGVHEVVETGPGATRALALVEEALRAAPLEPEQIDRLVIGLGPGSYTGIRAAIALAQGWQLARPVKLQGFSSAECLARQARASGLGGRVNIVIDAQRHEFYLARYEIQPGGCREVEPLRLASRAEVQERGQAGEVLTGPEITRWFPAGRILFPSAAQLAQMAAEGDDFVSGEKLEPIYLRPAQFVKAPAPRGFVPW